MKTVYMRQFYMGVVADIKNLEQHFADMAEKGWMIDKLGSITHRYRAIEPSKKRFTVDLLPQITAFDYPENENAQDYRRICEESGWTFITSSRQLHVFCADGDNPEPMPIHTDNKIQVQIYMRACMKHELPWFLFALLMFGISFSFTMGFELFLSSIMTFLFLAYLCFIISFLWTFCFVIRWYLKVKKAFKYDLPMPVVNRGYARARNKVFGFGFIAFIVLMTAGIVLELYIGRSQVFLMALMGPIGGGIVGLWIRRLIDTKRRDRGSNILMSLVVIVASVVVITSITTWMIMSFGFSMDSHSLGDRPALRLHDVGVTVPPEYINTWIKGSVVVPVNYDHWETAGQASVNTQVYRSISGYIARGLYGTFAKEFESRFNSYFSEIMELDYLSTNEAAFWGAEEGVAMFSSGDNRYIRLLLLRDKMILELGFYGDNMDIETVAQAVREIFSKR